MSKGSVSAAVVASILGLVADDSAWAQTPVKVGNEFAVNTFTVGDQYDSQVAWTAGGGFVIVWTSAEGDGSYTGVFARRFASSGAPLAPQFQVTTYTTSYQNNPAVDRDNAGNFVLTWASYGEDGGSSGIFARRFNAAGVAQGVVFQVNTYTPGAQSTPAVAVDADGDFVIAWTSANQDGAGGSGVFARRFNASGAPQGAEFQANSYTPGQQSAPAVDLDATGDFVIVWHSPHDANIFGVFGQRFNASGAPQGAEFLVNTYQTASQSLPVVGIADGGDFVVAWQSQGQDGSGYGVFARRFDSSGTPQAAEFLVPAYAFNDQGRPSISTDADGDFVITWGSLFQDGSGYGTFARRFKASGIPQSGDLPVNSFTTDGQLSPAVAADADGNFVVAWSSDGQDGYDGGIFAQRFEVPAVLDIDGNGSLGALTDGLLVLRFLFGFTGPTLTSGAVGAGCLRCDSAAILPYLQSLT